LPYLRVEIKYAVTHEGALSVDDVMSRRTRINFEASDQGLSIVNEVADLIAPTLQWSDLEKRSSIDDYLRKVSEQNEELAASLGNKSKVS